MDMRKILKLILFAAMTMVAFSSCLERKIPLQKTLFITAENDTIVSYGGRILIFDGASAEYRNESLLIK